MFCFLNTYNCYYLFLVQDFSGRRPSFFEFNFRPSVGAWRLATGVKQRLVYANGRGGDAVSPVRLLSHRNSCSPLLSSIKTSIFYIGREAALKLAPHTCTKQHILDEAQNLK